MNDILIKLSSIENLLFMIYGLLELVVCFAAVLILVFLICKFIYFILR